MATQTRLLSEHGSIPIARRSPRLAGATRTFTTPPVSPSSGAALPRAGWKSLGSCNDVDRGLFFGPDNAPMPKEQVRAARAVCLDCPVWQDCLVSSIDYDEHYGVWAALTPEERGRAMLVADGDIELIMQLWVSRELFLLVVLR